MEKYKHICPECKQEFMAPMKPREGKEFYCPKCFIARRNKKEEKNDN